MRVSVIICTYNRTETLEDAILSIHRQDFPVDEFELVIVDNNSSDNTRELVSRLAGVSPCKMIYIFEGIQGHSRAGNTGVQHSKGEIIAFTDDDVIADVSWLRSIVSAFDSNHVCAVGGPIRPLWPFQKPDWVTEEIIFILAINEFSRATESGEFQYPNSPCGANMAFRRDIFITFGGFSLDLGRVGGNLISNGEVDLFRRLAQAGQKIKFISTAIIHHKIAPDRLTKAWFLRRFCDQGRSDAIMDMRDDEMALFRRIESYINALSYATPGNLFVNDCFVALVIGYFQYLFFTDDMRISRGNLTERVLSNFIKEIAESMHLGAMRFIQLQSTTAELQSVREELTMIKGTLGWTFIKNIYRCIDKVFPYDSKRLKYLQLIKKNLRGGS